MRQRQTDNTCRRSHVSNLSPKEVACLIATHLTVGSLLTLVLLHLKLIVIDALGTAERIVAIHVNMRVLVFPVEVVGGTPLVVCLVKSVAHIVATVATRLQSARIVAVVINDIHAHHVTIAETVVVDTCHCQLVDVARELYAVAVVLTASAIEQVVATSRQEQCS